MKKAFIITTSILSIIILVLGIFLFNTTHNLTATSASLESLYQRSFFDLVDNVNNMEVDVSKLMVSNDSTSQQEILASIKQKTSDAENDLSLLPINSNLLDSTTKFMNQLNGYCTSLISYKEGKIEKEDYNIISNVYSSIATIKNELNNVMEKIMSGYRISDNIGDENIVGDFSSSLSNLTNDTIEYPTLIYDGPFSEASIKREIKGLPNDEISQSEAEALIPKILGNDITNISFLGETNGNFQTFDFGVNTNNGKNYYLQITKRGGFLLNMNSNSLEEDRQEPNEEEKIALDNEENLNNSQASKIAVNFSKKLGLENMQATWSASSNKICYINLAPVEDNIILYPDLIKVKIDLVNNQILGWEASSYAYNHCEREDLIPQLSEEDARKLISENLKVNSTKLCVIPLDYMGETLAYEFSGKYNNFNYYLYIDAYNGKQVRVLRIIQTDEGNLVM